VNLSGDLERVQWCTKRMTHSHTFCVVVWTCVHISYYHSGERRDILTAPPHILQSGNTNESYGTHLAACWKLKVMELDVCVCVFSARDEQICPGAGICVCIFSIYQ
jgi:hypothetical protein